MTPTRDESQRDERGRYIAGARARPMERFLRLTEKGPECWEWRGSRDWSGYGQFGLDGRVLGAHRVAYLLFVGPIPPGLTIDHLCRNAGCVNPAHLEVVTQRVNTLRGHSPAALQATQTECRRGHPFSGPNLWVSRGRRRCRQCNLDWQRARRRGGRAA